MAVISMKALLEAGVHFGHQTRRWNPKMKKFIFAERDGIYIVDLQKTLKCIKDAYQLVKETVAQGELVLFVGTKKQAKETTVEEAQRCGMFYVTERWLGGMLTNFNTIKRNVQRLKELQTMSQNGTFDKLPKKEVLNLIREEKKLEKLLGGIKEMGRLPGLVFVVDAKKEKIAINEARKLDIPVIAILDTNGDPDQIDYPIPGNDDAIREIKLITKIIANAVIDGKALLAERTAYEQQVEEPAVVTDTSEDNTTETTGTKKYK